jgi:hypothetical protein
MALQPGLDWTTLRASGFRHHRRGLNFGLATLAIAHESLLSCCRQFQTRITRSAVRAEGYPLRSFRLYVGLTNDSAEVVILFPEKSAKICAAHPDRIKPLCDKLALDLERL